MPLVGIQCNRDINHNRIIEILGPLLINIFPQIHLINSYCFVPRKLFTSSFAEAGCAGEISLQKSTPPAAVRPRAVTETVSRNTHIQFHSMLANLSLAKISREVKVRSCRLEHTRSFFVRKQKLTDVLMRSERHHNMDGKKM